MDFKNLKANRVCIVTDENVAKLDAMKQAVEALSHEGVEFTVFDRVRIEPKDSSVKEAIDFAKPYGADAYLAVGGSIPLALNELWLMDKVVDPSLILPNS